MSPSLLMKFVMSHIQISYVTHMNESHHLDKCIVIAHPYTMLDMQLKEPTKCCLPYLQVRVCVCVKVCVNVCMCLSRRDCATVVCIFLCVLLFMVSLCSTSGKENVGVLDIPLIVVVSSRLQTHF